MAYTGAGVPAQGLAHLMARIARHLDTEQGLDTTMHALVAAAVGAIPGAESAAITEVRRRGQHLKVAYPSDPFVIDLDATQYELGEGPCLDAAYQHRTVRVEDFATEQRWPVFAGQAHDLVVLR